MSSVFTRGAVAKSFDFVFDAGTNFGQRVRRQGPLLEREGARGCRAALKSRILALMFSTHFRDLTVL
jgi:hypothetical protein